MRKINNYQKELYGEYEAQGSKRYFDRYEKYLSKFKGRKNLKILDIGGASGYFAMLLKTYFGDSTEVYVLDITEYDTWDKEILGDKIHFVCDSVENMENWFSDHTFDIIFANRVFHHFIDESWQKTLLGIEHILIVTKRLLREQGMLCIMDHFYNGSFWDSASSRLIYQFTSIRNPVLSGCIKRLGAATAGVGVCFLSEKMWFDRIQRCGFAIEKIERSQYYKLNVIKRIALLSKSVSRNNIICAIPDDRINNTM